MTTTRTYSHSRIDIPADGFDSWVDVQIQEQHDAESGALVLRLIEWAHMTSTEHRTLRGPSGRSYWFPADPASGSFRAQMGSVYAQHSDAGNSFMLDFETGDGWSVDDLLNLASAACDGEYWPYLPAIEAGDPGDTNPFRQFVPVVLR